MKKIVAIIQARMGSNRLPGKVLKKVKNKPLLSYMIKQVKACKTIDDIIIATTRLEEDDPIVSLANSLNVIVYRGSSDDVLDRYYDCAKTHSAEIIVRLSADSPLIDYNIIDKCVNQFRKKTLDYLSNTIKKNNSDWIDSLNGFPIGCATEVFTFNALKNAWKYCKKSFEREHVTEYIIRNPEIFRLGCIENPENFSNIRIVVDYQKDFDIIRKIIEDLGDTELFTLEKILHFFNNNAHLKD